PVGTIQDSIQRSAVSIQPRTILATQRQSLKRRGEEEIGICLFGLNLPMTKRSVISRFSKSFL
ncbi:MAG TPA: hypothetical protein VFR84_10325, partial [Candidatus Angelobacter sp.]|nr:hypothetical protein [Candidatus Angelobacter sp.]